MRTMLILMWLLLLPSFSHAGASISFVNEVRDFGTVRKGELLEATFDFSNTGNEDLIISRLTPS